MSPCSTRLLSVFPVLLLTLGAACGERGAPSSAPERDDFGAEIPAFDNAPSRIVSLDPAITELLFAIGAGPRVVGRTHWDRWPDSALLVRDLGPGLQPNVEAVLGTRPDLVILYAGEDNRGAARRLEAAGVPVLALKIDRIESLRRAARLIGNAVDRRRTADSVIASLDSALEHVRVATRGLPRPTVFWHAWDAPLITIGSRVFRSELLEIAGGRNIYDDLSQPSPRVSLEDVVRRDPQVIIAGPESAARIRRDPAWRSITAVREGRVIAIDETALSSASVRMGRDAALLARLLHPGIAL